MAAADNDHDFGMASASRPQPSTSTAHPQQAQSQPAQESHADDSLSRNVNDVTGISADASVGSDASGGAAEPRENPSGTFECNICLDTAKDAVVSMCGHLFCWPCLHQWLETRPMRQMCPVCKAGISKEKVIPLYGRGSTDQQDPREKVPPRPAGQRAEPETNTTGPAFGFSDAGFQMSFGIGAFPFGFFASTFTNGGLNNARPPPAAPGTPQYNEDQFLSKVFLWVAVLFIFWLLIA